MSPERRKEDKYPKRDKNKAGRYSTVNDDTARGAMPINNHGKKSNKTSIIVSIIIIVIFISISTFLFFNWNKIVRKTNEQSNLGTPTPIPTAIATPTPTISPTPTPIATPVPTPIATKTPPPEIVDITISAIGDIMCHQAQLEDAYDEATDTYDFSSNFAEIAPSLQKSDLVIGSILTTFMGVEQEYSGLPLFNTPNSMLSALADAGIDVLTTGNSHIFDYGWIGVERTNKAIKEAGISTTGTYFSEHDYYEPLILDVNGVNVAILSFTDTTNGNERKISSARLDYCIKYIRKSKIRDNIEIARNKGADIVILCLHWGEEYNRIESTEMRETAQYAIEHGADLIFGTKPHVIQRIARKSQKAEDGITRQVLIAYSLGNFISNQREIYRDSGMILNVHYRKNTITGDISMIDAEYIPTWVYTYDTDENAAKNFKIIPVGKYLTTPDLLGTLSENSKARLEQVWFETTTMIGTGIVRVSNE